MTAKIAATSSSTPRSMRRQAPSSTAGRAPLPSSTAGCGSAPAAPRRRTPWPARPAPARAAFCSGATSISLTFMPSFFTAASDSASLSRRHRAHDVGRRACAPFCSTACSPGVELLPFRAARTTRKVGSIRCRVIAMQQATSLNLNDTRGRRGVLVAVEHAALQRGVDLAEVHRRGVGAHRVDRRRRTPWSGWCGSSGP